MFSPLQIDPSGHPQRRKPLAGIGIAAALHALVLAAVVAADRGLTLPAPMPRLTVDILTPNAPQPPQPRVLPPKPKPVTRQPDPRPVAPPQVLATKAEAPSSEVQARVPDTPAPPPPPVAAPPAPPALVAVVEPRFDADYLDNPKPAYPPISRRLGEEGKVLLRVYVEPDGRPSQIQVKTGSGSPRLDQAAQDTVWRWRFQPARRGDQAVAAWVLVPIVYTLRG